jgi:alkylated DNA repair dioxygenase AlkB
MTQETAPARHARLAPPDGWRYEAEFLDPAEEGSLLQTLRELPFQAARYKEWTARRRIVSYGGRYDFNRNVLEPAAALPAVFEPLRSRVAEWAGIPAGQLSHATVAEYPRATPLGWHRDVPEFELVVGVSLGGHARMRFRPYPHEKGSRTVFAIDLEPRSIYLLRGAVRWNWQHAISETKELRYSITFRSRRSAR